MIIIMVNIFHITITIMNIIIMFVTIISIIIITLQSWQALRSRQ